MEFVNYNDEQRAQMASRIVQDAIFIGQGAEITPVGRLELSTESLKYLENQNIADEIGEFENTTPEGQQIAKNSLFLDDMAAYTNPRGWAKPLRATSADRYLSDMGPVLQDRLRTDGIVVNFDDYDADNPVKHRAMTQSIDAMRDGLRTTTKKIYRNENIRFGKTVNVLRNGRNGNEPYVEANWTIERILLNGAIEVVSPDRKDVKKIAVDSLLQYNRYE